MALVKDRHIGRYLHSDGAVVEPATLAGAEVLPDGQVQPITDSSSQANLYVRKGGDLVPAVEINWLSITSQESVTVEVNPATGVSPGPAFIVRNQAEYDALGSPFKYVQDALDAIPLNEDHLYKINLSAGVHTERPGHGGPDDQVTIAIPNIGMSSRYINTDYSEELYGLGIIINGTKSVVEASIVGTSTYISANDTNTFTRTAGVWVEGEMRGKIVEVVSGSGSGDYAVIANNTTTVLELTGGLSPVGACTIDIVEPGSSIEPVSPGFFGMVGAWGFSSGNTFRFNWIRFGSDGDTLDNNYISGVSLQFYNCQFYCNDFRLAREWGETVQSVRMFYCYLEGTLEIAAQNNLIDLSFSVLYGNVVTYARSEGMLYAARAFFIAKPGFSGEILNIEEGMGFNASGRVVGNDLCIGIGYHSSTRDPDANAIDSLSIEDCLMGMTVEDIRIIRVNTVATTSSGNATGYRIISGSRLLIGTPSNMGVTVTADISIDGDIYDYSELSSQGDEIIGVNGSSIMRARS